MRALIRISATGLLLSTFMCGLSFAQHATLTSFGPDAFAVTPLVSTPTPQQSSEERHKFWDKENSILFATNAALAGADFAVTRQNLQNGGRELNPITRLMSGSTAGLAANFAGETAGVIGLSYFFHRTGHHKLERITSMVNIGASGFAVTYGLSHR